jgi:hypothetical protein
MSRVLILYSHTHTRTLQAPSTDRGDDGDVKRSHPLLSHTHTLSPSPFDPPHCLPIQGGVKSTFLPIFPFGVCGF